MTEARLTAWTPAVHGIREVLHATFPAGSHAYPLHTHDSWTLLLVDAGTVRYRLHRTEHLAGSAGVTLLPPHVPHDGSSADREGFRKRVVYLDEGSLDRKFIDLTLHGPTRSAPRLWSTLDRLHRVLVEGLNPMAAESALESLLSAVGARWGSPDPVSSAERDRESSHSSQRRMADQLRMMLDASIPDGLTLQEAADTLGASRSGLVHAFRRHVGMPPHRYLVSRRLDRARALLLQGLPPAEVAVTVGFHDQAHLTRHFKRLLGVPPATWAAGSPDR